MSFVSCADMKLRITTIYKRKHFLGGVLSVIMEY